MSAYLDELNAVQRSAVTHTEGPVMVVAGPGSGKTRVLTYRIAHIIEQGAAPWEVLALTFTNKAAREMKERIGKVVGARADKVWAGTFHAIFARLLRMEAEKIGYPSNFTIYDTDDSKSVISNLLKEMQLDPKVYNVNTVRHRISAAKSSLITPKLYEANEQLRSEDKMAKMPYIYAIYEKYVARCKRAGAMDFDDLLFRMFELLQKNPDGVTEKYRQKFKYLLVDEFQDTNFLQYAIIKKLALYPDSPRNICVVGDDAQSIYAFRGATIENILNFERDFPDLATYKLEQNYRSTNHIVAAANEVINFNPKQIKKNIWTDKQDGEKIRVIRAMTDAEEGKRVADLILEQKNRYHLRHADIAILYRTNAQSRVFEEHLRRYNLPYRIFGGQSFYQRKEVKDLIAYLRFAVNPKDEEALRRIINYPRRGIGDSTVSGLAALANEQGLGVWDILPQAELPARAKTAVVGFATMAQLFIQKAQHEDAYQAATYIAKQSGLLNELKGDTTAEGVDRLNNVNALLDGIKEFAESDEQIGDIVDADRSLAAYLQNIALLTDMDAEAQHQDFITLMSAHSAKGLEFPSVFVVGAEENLFPSWMALRDVDGVDEERRLFYVAITRAERFLTLSYATSRYQNGQMRYNEPSRFLSEISRDNLESNAPLRGHHERQDAATPTAKVSGKFGTVAERPPVLGAAPEDFKPSAAKDIVAGKQVLHLRFGKGEVRSVEGAGDNRLAVVVFQQAGEKRIMLKFAKLQVIG